MDTTRDVSVFLDVPEGPGAEGAIERALEPELASYAADGWEPEHTTTYRGLKAAGRLVAEGSILGGGGLRFVVARVTLRRRH